MTSGKLAVVTEIYKSQILSSYSLKYDWLFAYIKVPLSLKYHNKKKKHNWLILTKITYAFFLNNCQPTNPNIKIEKKNNANTFKIS